VESVLGEKSLPFSGSSDTIQVFRHALSLDEHRVKFKPSFCTGGKREDQRTEDETDVKEVFFAGAHSGTFRFSPYSWFVAYQCPPDVGGGSVKNGTRHSLARISLRWMIRECFINQTGIIFDAHMVNQVGLDINSIDKAPEALPSAGSRSSASARFSLTSVVTVPALWLWNKVPQFRPLPAREWDFEGEAQEELNDALSPINDQLKIHPIWYLMELVRRKLHPQIHLHRRRATDTVSKNPLRRRRTARASCLSRHSSFVAYHRSPAADSVTDFHWLSADILEKAG
jgi:hypothetical protein